MSKTGFMKQEKEKNKKGSMLIAVVIIFAIIAGIAVAIIFRTTQGAQISVGTRKSTQSYQTADQYAESVIDGFKRLDVGDTAYFGALIYGLSCGGGLCIPENITLDQEHHCNFLAANFSPIKSSSCYTSATGDESSRIGVGSSAPVSEIKAVKLVAQEGDVKRSVFVPLPARRVNTDVEFDAFRCDTVPVGADACNNADSNTYGRVIWKTPSNVDDYDGVMIIKCKKNATCEGDLSDLDCAWEEVVQNNVNCEIDNDTGNSNNYCEFFLEAGFGQDIYITMKVKNKKNFELDSLYLDIGGTVPINIHN